MCAKRASHLIFWNQDFPFKRPIFCAGRNDNGATMDAQGSNALPKSKLQKLKEATRQAEDKEAAKAAEPVAESAAAISTKAPASGQQSSKVPYRQVKQDFNASKRMHLISLL